MIMPAIGSPDFVSAGLKLADQMRANGPTRACDQNSHFLPSERFVFVLTGPRTYFVLGAAAITFWAAGFAGCGDPTTDEAEGCPLTAEACADIEGFAPDPGGKEGAEVQLPVDDKAVGFNDSPQVAGVKPAELETLARLAGANARRFPLDWRQLEPVRDVHSL